MDMAQVCVDYAGLRGIELSAATKEITRIVEVLLFGSEGLSNTYQRLRRWADEHQGGNISRTVRLSNIYGSQILAAGLFDQLEISAKKEGVAGQELLVRILSDYFKANQP